ncbi:MAG: DUF4112 domain-containing protein [Granulosicoccus sp.]
MTQNTDQSDSDVARRKLDRFSKLMDSSIRLPGGYRIGWDGVIGLVPGIGDLVGTGISLYILLQARRLGASRTTLLRMLGNVGVETVIGSIPVIGDVFDLTFKANNRNMRLLDQQVADPESISRESNLRFYVVLLTAFMIFLLCAWLIISLLVTLLTWIF